MNEEKLPGQENLRQAEEELPEREQQREPEEQLPGQEDLRQSEVGLPGKKKRRRPFLKGFAAGALAMLALSFVLTGIGRAAGSGGFARSGVLDLKSERKINALVRAIRSSYYEEVDPQELEDGMYAGLFSNLDEYSRYYTPEEYNELYESSVSGTYCGIGASLQQDEDNTVTVVFVYDGSPAKEAGLQAGDEILSADGYEAGEMDLTSLVSHIRGEKGTKVHLEVYRADTAETLEFDIPRKEMELPTVTGEMLERKTGYIDVTEFTSATPGQFREALDKLQGEGMEALIVDLRANPGGMLDAVCEMADEILPEGLIVYTQERSGKREEYRSTDEKSLDIPLAVLVDGQSASASEIFAGAVQDRHAGTVIGTNTFGKGVVQTIRTLNDGSAYKLTTSRYFTPGGTCIQDIGIKPDVELEYKFLGGEEDEYSYSLDNQIRKAIELLHGENSR